jgi:hypothetical protein
MAKPLKSVGQACRAINSAVKSGSIRALNKALTKTKNKLVKDLKDDTGLKSETLSKRILLIKARSKNLKGSINIATKIDVQLSAFSPKEKGVKVPGKRKPGTKGRPKSRTYIGVTVKMGKSARQLVPGGFLRTVRSGKEIILTRTNDTRYPVKAMKSDVLKQSAKARQNEAIQYLQKEFAATNKIEIDAALAKKNK